MTFLGNVRTRYIHSVKKREDDSTSAMQRSSKIKFRAVVGLSRTIPLDRPSTASNGSNQRRRDRSTGIFLRACYDRAINNSRVQLG